MANVAKEVAVEIEDRILNEGALTEDDVNDFALEHGVPESRLKYVHLNLHSSKRLRKTSDPEGNGKYYEPAPAVNSGNGHTDGVSPIAEDWPRLASPEEQVQGLLENLGVQYKPARGAATVMSAYDLSDPAQLIEALSVSNLSPIVRRQFAVTWSRNHGLDFTSQHLQTLHQMGASQSQSYQQGQGQPQEYPKKYIVIDGRPVPTPAGEPGMYSWAEAMQVCQLEKQGGGDGGGGVLGALVQWMGQSQESQIEGLKAIMQAQNHTPDGMSDVSTRVIQAALDSLLSPKAAAPYNISFQTGENGETASMPFDLLERLQNMQLAASENAWKGQMLQIGQQLIPDLLAAGRAAAQHVETGAGAPNNLQPNQPQQQEIRRNCVGCGEQLIVPAGHSNFQCPVDGCGVVQTVGGVILDKMPNPQPQQRQQAPQQPQQQQPLRRQVPVDNNGAVPTGRDFDSVPQIPQSQPTERQPAQQSQDQEQHQPLPFLGAEHVDFPANYMVSAIDEGSN